MWDKGTCSWKAAVWNFVSQLRGELFPLELGLKTSLLTLCLDTERKREWGEERERALFIKGTPCLYRHMTFSLMATCI